MTNATGRYMLWTTQFGAASPPDDGPVTVLTGLGDATCEHLRMQVWRAVVGGGGAVSTLRDVILDKTLRGAGE